MTNYIQGKWYAFVVTLFLYSLIIVDLYRKLVPGGAVEQLRNLIYIVVFGLIVVEMIRCRRINRMLSIAAATLFIYFVSFIINDGYNEVYSSSVILFISRLWPSYFIGRFTEDWKSISKMVLLFSPFALLYSISLFIIPELLSGDAYATIASNLAYVSLIYSFIGFRYKNVFGIICALVCLVPVFFFGTRAVFVGIATAYLLFYLLSSSVSRSRMVIFVIIILALLVVYLYIGDAIMTTLSDWFPNSRTLKMITHGDLLDDSNRFSSYYGRLLGSIAENPFRIYGFIGDRIFLAGASASTAVILSSFSHNCILELCMNFGLFIGLVVTIKFLISLKKAASKCFRDSHKEDLYFIFIPFLGIIFVNMMVSSSYLSDYAIWLLFGLAYRINNTCNKC